jgi:hypothetical protein
MVEPFDDETPLAAAVGVPIAAGVVVGTRVEAAASEETSWWGLAGWEVPLCGCFHVKDAGMLCCLSNVCCAACVFSSALEAARLGPCAPDMRCCAWCVCLSLLPCCTYAWARLVVARNFSIAETHFESCLLGFCCPGCTHVQVGCVVAPTSLSPLLS